MSFTLTIEITRPVTRVIGPKWQLIGPEGTGRYGYTPEIEATETETVKIVETTLDFIDVQGVMAVALGLVKP